MSAFDDWSRTVPEKYKDADLPKKWESFGRRVDGNLITLGTLFQTAKVRGWVESEFHTDLGNARRLVARYGADIRFVPEWHKWIVWNETRWRVDDDGAIMRFAKETVEFMYAEALRLGDERKKAELIKHALKSQAAARLDAMVSLANTEANIVLPAQQLDADPWILGLENGVLELRTGKFRAPDRQDFVTKRMAAADPGTSVEITSAARLGNAPARLTTLEWR